MREVALASHAEQCANISDQNAHAGGLKLQLRTIHQLRNTILEDLTPFLPYKHLFTITLTPWRNTTVAPLPPLFVFLNL